MSDKSAEEDKNKRSIKELLRDILPHYHIIENNLYSRRLVKPLKLKANKKLNKI